MSENVRVNSGTSSEGRFMDQHMDELSGDARISIQDIEDIVQARQKGRSLAQELNFSPTQSTLVATVISELARNIILYAGNGLITLTRIKSETGRECLQIVASDNGPGIEDISRALISGYSSSGGLGLGLPGVRQLADEFHIKSVVGYGTTVTVSMFR